MREDSQILAILGLPSRANISAHEAIRVGLPTKVLATLAAAFGVERRKIESLVGLRASMPRRGAPGAKSLTCGQSENVHRLARAVVRARGVLDDTKKAERWFSTPNKALGGSIPIELLDTEPGTERVMNVLAQIEYGIY